MRCFLASTTCVVLYPLYCRIYRKLRKLPPGPSFPILTQILKGPAISSYIPLHYRHHLTYFWLNSRFKFCALHNPQIAKQVFSNIHCQNRGPLFLEMIPNEPDLLRVEYGKQWKERRKLVRSVLLTMEDSHYVDTNVRRFIDKYFVPRIDTMMKEQEYVHSKEIGKSIRHLTFSMILKVMFGEEVSPDNPLFLELSTLYEEWALSVVKAAMIHTFPIPRFLFGRSSVERVKELESKLDGLVKKHFFDPQIRKQDGNEKMDKITYFDHALGYIQSAETNRNNITLEQLLVDFRILIQASIDTASFILQNALLHLIKYDHIQQILHDELTEQFPDGQFTLKKVNKCPRFRAYINEILRIALPIPDGVPRYTTDDIEVNFEDNAGIKREYVIPKGTGVMLNLAFMHYGDRTKWKETTAIDLNHWLEKKVGADGQETVTFKNRKDVFPFSVGARDCVGRSLALRLLYSIIATMILKYEWNRFDDKFEIKTRLIGGSNRMDTDCNLVLTSRS